MGGDRGSHREGAAAVDMIKVRSQFPIWVSSRRNKQSRVLAACSSTLVHAWYVSPSTHLSLRWPERITARTHGLAPHYLSQPS